MKCPNCSGTLYYDIALKKLKCQSCGAVSDVKDYEEDASASEDIIEGARLYTCKNCGAELISANDEAVSFCTYCGSQQLLQSQMSGVKRPKYIIPFSVTKDQCKKIYEKEVSSKVFVPKEFKDPDFIERFRPFFIPYWMYRVSFRQDPLKFKGHKTYTAGGYDYFEDYDVSVKLDESAYGVPYDASRNFDDAIAEHIAPFSRKYLRNYQPGYLAGMYADSPNVDADVYEKEVLEKASHMAVEKMKASLGNIELELPVRKKKLQEFLMAKKEGADTFYLPVWFLTWKKDERVAYAVVNGQSGKIHIDLPADMSMFTKYTAIGAGLLFVLLTLFVSVTSRFVIWFAALLVYLVGIRYHQELKQIRNRENHVFDKGYLLSDEKELPMSEKKRDRLRKRAASYSGNVAAILMGSGLAFCFLIFAIAGEMYDFLVSQQGAIVLTFIILVLETVRFFKQIEAARYLKNKRSLFICFLGLASIIYAFAVASAEPVQDWWYYLGALICLMAASAMSIDLILRYNETSTRPLPSFYERKGGNDRA